MRKNKYTVWLDKSEEGLGFIVWVLESRRVVEACTGGRTFPGLELSEGTRRRLGRGAVSNSGRS